MIAYERIANTSRKREGLAATRPCSDRKRSIESGYDLLLSGCCPTKIH